MDKIMGLRKSRYKGTNRGTKGTIVNQTLLFVPRFLYQDITFGRYLDFRIGKSRYQLRLINFWVNFAIVFSYSSTLYRLIFFTYLHVISRLTKLSAVEGGQ